MTGADLCQRCKAVTPDSLTGRPINPAEAGANLRRALELDFLVWSPRGVG